jgi:hypothetical protein
LLPFECPVCVYACGPPACSMISTPKEQRDVKK